jgi:ABC-type transporter Mla subunit MlaD
VTGRSTAALLVGAAMLLLCAVLVATLLLLGGRTLARGDVLHVSFGRIGSLKEGAEVRISGLRIGRVLAVRHVPSAGGAGGKVLLDLWIERDHARLVRRNSVLYIGARGAIGEMHLEVGFPRGEPGPPAREGDLLEGEDPPQLDRMIQYGYENLGMTLALARELSPELRALGAAIDRFAAHLEGIAPPERLRDLAARGAARARGGAVRARVEAIAAWMSEIGELVSSSSERAAAAGERLRGSVRDAAEIVGGLEALRDLVLDGRGSLGRMIADPKLVDEVKEAHRLLKEAPWRVLSRPPH